MAHVIDYVEFAVDDLEQAKAFYANALGWAFNDYGPDYAGIQDPTRPGQEFGGLNPHPATSRGDGVVALARTDDADASLASILAARRPDRSGAQRVSRREAIHVRRPMGKHPRDLPAKRVAQPAESPENVQRVGLWCRSSSNIPNIPGRPNAFVGSSR
jgi:catechol 2,3-dioxygenase-like lactoylglutathione lyase family enzyme